MADRIIGCVECGRRFVWSAGEQRFYHERGLSAPKRCPGCRSPERPGMRGLVGAPPKRPAGADRRWAQALRQAQASQRAPAQRSPGGQARPGMGWWGNPLYRHGFVVLFTALALMMVFTASSYRLGGVVLWLLAINVVGLITYTYDKVIAGSRRTRVPEYVLLMIAGLGGALGAYLAMRAAHHKTSKDSFIDKFRGVVVAQLVVVIVLYLLFRSQLSS